MLNINNKILKYGLVGLVALVLIVSGIDYTITQIKLSKIPPSLRINTDKDNIIGAQTIPNGKIYDKEDPKKVIYEGEVVKYAYKTDKIEDKPNEVVEKRTKHSRTVKIAEDNEKITYQLEVISGVPQYYEDENGEWYQADYGTTNLNTYSLETKGSVLANLFFPNKVYATESPFYPEPNPETSTVDGYIYREASGSSWANLRDGGGGFQYSGESDSIGSPSRIDADGNWFRLMRGIFLFDTSSLTSSAIISDAVLSLYGSSKVDNLNILPNIDIYTSTPASNTSLVGADFSQVGSISQTGNPISFNNFTNSVYNNFTFNTTGKGNISKTGISKFGARNANYDVANVEPTWSLNQLSYININFAETAGTSQDPKLVVTYTSPVPGRFFQMF